MLRRGLGQSVVVRGPLDPAVRAGLRRVRPGESIRLQGVLVDVHWSDERLWKTSLTREDTGAGACEIVWVHGVERLD